MARLVAIMVAAAMVGVLVDTTRVIALIVFLGCAAALAVTYLNRSK